MSFDAITEDREESFPCDCGGDIIKFNGNWECNKYNKHPGEKNND